MLSYHQKKLSHQVADLTEATPAVHLTCKSSKKETDVMSKELSRRSFVKKSFHLYYRIPPEQYFLQIIVCDNCNDMRHKRR